MDVSRGILFRHCIIIHCQPENQKYPFGVSSGRRSLLKKPSLNEHNERKASKSGSDTAKVVPLLPTCRQPDWVLVSEELKQIAIVDLNRPSDEHPGLLLAAA